MNDLISRQAAIDVASGYCHPANIAKELANLPSVQPDLDEVKQMSRYIDADRLKEELIIPSTISKAIMVQIDDQPTADVRENVNGEWIEKHYTINCSVCKKCLWSGPYIDLVKKFNFCPNCGADMRPITALSKNAEIDSNLKKGEV